MFGIKKKKKTSLFSLFNSHDIQLLFSMCQLPDVGDFSGIVKIKSFKKICLSKDKNLVPRTGKKLKMANLYQRMSFVLYIRGNPQACVDETYENRKPQSHVFEIKNYISYLAEPCTSETTEFRYAFLLK